MHNLQRVCDVIIAQVYNISDYVTLLYSDLNENKVIEQHCILSTQFPNSNYRKQTKHYMHNL